MTENELLRRDTPQRRIVYEAVMHRFDHPTADAVYDEIHAHHPKISKGTVYRNLKYLAESGEILQVKLPGADRFDSTLKNHCHIFCTRCGAVCDAPVDYSAENDKKVARKTGYKIFAHLTVFEGLCPECLK